MIEVCGGIVDADSTSMQASGEGVGNVGICQSSRKRIRIHDGGCHLHTCGYPGLVPVRLGIPNQASIQPSFQTRAWYVMNSGWWEEAKTQVNTYCTWLEFRVRGTERTKMYNI